MLEYYSVKRITSVYSSSNTSKQTNKSKELKSSKITEASKAFSVGNFFFAVNSYCCMSAGWSANNALHFSWSEYALHKHAPYHHQNVYLQLICVCIFFFKVQPCCRCRRRRHHYHRQNHHIRYAYETMKRDSNSPAVFRSYAKKQKRWQKKWCSECLTAATVIIQMRLLLNCVAYLEYV